VRIVERVLDSGTGRWNSIELMESSTFPIGGVRSGGKDYWYLSGVDESGKTVFEQWQLSPEQPTPVGQDPTKRIVRTEIYRGPSESMIDFAVDPERRFLLALVRDASGTQFLYRLALAQGSTPRFFMDGMQVQDLRRITDSCGLPAT